MLIDEINHGRVDTTCAADSACNSESFMMKVANECKYFLVDYFS